MTPSLQKPQTEGEKLLPCPFCGNPPQFDEGEDHEGHFSEARIWCEAHECFGPSTTAAMWQDAIIQWNTRSSAAAPRGALIEALQLIESTSSVRAASIARDALALFPAPAPTVGRQDEAENALLLDEAKDNLALIDFIADRIGLPHNRELSRENFADWLSHRVTPAVTKE